MGGSEELPEGEGERRLSRRGWLCLVGAAFAVMFSLGFLDNLRGPLIPSWVVFFQVSYSDIGFFLFFSSLGYLLSTFVGGFAADRWGHKRVILAGFGVVAAVIAGYQGVGRFVPFLLLSFGLNAGFGLLDIGLNSLGARIFVRHTALMMNYLHLFFGLGSSAGPLFAGRVLGAGGGWSLSYLGALALVVPVFLFLAAVPFPDRRVEAAAESDGSRPLPRRPLVRPLVRRILPFGLLLAFCEILEIGTAGWLANYLQVVRGMPPEVSSRYLAAFFLAFTLGRAFAGAVPDRLGRRRAMALFAGMGALSLILGMVLPGAPWIFAFTGLAASILFPTVMAMIMDCFPRQSGRAMGMIISLAGVVNMTYQWFIGGLNDWLSVAAGFTALLAAPAGILFFLFILPSPSGKQTDSLVE